MASEDPEVPQHGTAVKKEHVSLTVPQKVEIIRRLESGKSQSVIIASYNTGYSTVYYIKKRTNFNHL
jgi:CENP-B N-terminal DNA-binding domain.